jgi:hypothetical protein
MKKGVFILSILILMAFIPFVISDENSQLSLAYSCLQNETNSFDCSSLSLEEKIFVFSSTGFCKESLMNSSSGNCFPKDSCDTKITSQAIIALEGEYNFSNYTSWILSRVTSSEDIEWLLQIDSSGTPSCTINNSENSYTVNIQSNKKISSSQNSNCFSIEDEYWIKINPSCYNKEITISCNSQFSTTLFFKNANSQTINLLGKTKTSSSGGTLKELPSSYCFKETGSCDYEASLWASFALDLSNIDTTPYVPYLISMKDSNRKFIPDSFLNYITGKETFSYNLFSYQKTEGYWNESGNPYYDTAIASIFLDSSEKQNAKNWFLSNQNSNGCWNNQSSTSTRDTSIILSSLWPEYDFTSTSINNSGNTTETPEELCGNGLVDINFGEQCDGENLRNNTCSDLIINSTGTLDCYPNEHEYGCQFDTSSCEGGIPECEIDSNCSGNSKCIENVCISPLTKNNQTTNKTTLPDCTEEGYYCASKSACFRAGGEQLNSYSCENSYKFCCNEDPNNPKVETTEDEEIENGKTCDFDSECLSGEECLNGSCVPETKKDKSSLIIILIVLITLMVLAILFIKFKDKIFKNKYSGNKPRPLGPKPFMPQRRISPQNFQRNQPSIKKQNITPNKNASKNIKPQERRISEREEVLKKLKEMSK